MLARLVLASRPALPSTRLRAAPALSLRGIRTVKAGSVEDDAKMLCQHAAHQHSASLFEILHRDHAHHQSLLKLLLKTKESTVKGFTSATQRVKENERVEDILASLTRAMRVHFHAEEQSVYKSLPVLAPNSEGLVAECVREHVELKAVLYRLEALTASDSGWRELVEWTAAKYDSHRANERELYRELEKCSTPEEQAAITEKFLVSECAAREVWRSGMFTLT